MTTKSTLSTLHMILFNAFLKKLLSISNIVARKQCSSLLHSGIVALEKRRQLTMHEIMDDINLRFFYLPLKDYSTLEKGINTNQIKLSKTFLLSY